MADSANRIVPVIVGPTAVGKTAVALELTEEYNFEIVSCDSRQIYKHLNIGTAKPTTAELRGKPITWSTMWNPIAFIQQRSIALMR